MFFLGRTTVLVLDLEDEAKFRHHQLEHRIIMRNC